VVTILHNYDLIPFGSIIGKISKLATRQIGKSATRQISNPANSANQQLGGSENFTLESSRG
jgi:hypothetical protein